MVLEIGPNLMQFLMGLLALLVGALALYRQIYMDQQLQSNTRRLDVHSTAIADIRRDAQNGAELK
jgi:hypothetical protein